MLSRACHFFQQPCRRLGYKTVQPTFVSVRNYRGDSGEATPELSPHEESLLKIARPKAEEIFERHIKIPADDIEARRKRLIYRSKQRGWLEVDLLLGTWAHQNVPNLQGDELDEFENFVNNFETIDLYNIITLRVDAPGDGVVQRIQEWARSSPLGKADPDTYKTVKTENKLI